MNILRWMALLIAVAFLAASNSLSAKTPIRIDDLYRLESATSVTVHMSTVFYVRQWIDPRTKQERNSLWSILVKPETAAAVEEGEPDARGPVFSPDGKWVAFRSTRRRPAGWQQTPTAPPESEPATDIWIVRVADMSIAPLAGPEKPYGRVFGDAFYGRLAFSPDSSQLAFVADDGVDPRTPEEIENDVLIVRPDQGEAYTGYGPAQLWIADLNLAAKPVTQRATTIRRITNDDVWHGDPQWTPDGKSLVVHANRTEDRESARFSINKNFDLWSIDVASGRLTQLTNGPGPEVSPRVSGDGRLVIALSSPRKGPHADVYNPIVVRLGEPLPNQRTLFDFHAEATDPPRLLRRYPSFPLPDDSPVDERELFYDSPLGTKSERMRLGLKSGSTPEPVGDDEPRRPGWFARGMTPKANPFLADRVIGETSVIRWTNDGMELEGVLTTPPEAAGFRPPYKLLLLPHGGPHSRSTTGFNFTVEVFAAHGFAVFQPNFRGSQGYGKKFVDADRRDLGGGDMRDMLTGIDYLVSQKVVDPSRQFVYGTSYGGYSTCWLVGATKQFRAAVTQNPVTDMNLMWGLSDIQSWTEWELGGKPWEIPEAMRKHSPLTYAHQVETPTLILHSRDDRRCPLPMGRVFHQTLRARSIPTQLVIYPREGHGIREPRHRVDVLQRAIGWFEKYDRRE